MAITGVAFTAYLVTDVARSVAFYQDALGLAKAGLESDFWVEFDVAGRTFGVGSFEQIGAPGSAQSFALEVSDLTSLRRPHHEGPRAYRAFRNARVLTLRLFGGKDVC
jgi:extradiol dioxygenase family protein